MPKLNWKQAPIAIRRRIEMRLDSDDPADLEHAVTLAFGADLDFPPDEVRKHCTALPELERLEQAGDKEGAAFYTQRRRTRLFHERRAVQYAEARRQWAKGEPEADVHARQVAEQRAAEREAAINRRAEELVELEEAAARVRKIQKARDQIAKEQLQ